MIDVCDKKINKNPNVGISFYVFFYNKNDNPQLLMQVAQWWILEHKLDHFEKATKIKQLLLDFQKQINNNTMPSANNQHF